jgi:large subunit ribosomal protein L10
MSSAKILEQKKKVVEELSSKIKASQSFVFADYRGLTVEQDTEMRSAMRKAGIEYKVYKNTLTKFAARANGYEGLEQYLEGPTAIAFSSTDMIAPSRVLADFAKKFEKLEIKAGVVEGIIYDGKMIREEIASTPSKEVSLSKLAGGFNAIIASLAIALNAVKEKKEQE